MRHFPRFIFSLEINFLKKEKNLSLFAEMQTYKSRRKNFFIWKAGRKGKVEP